MRISPMFELMINGSDPEFAFQRPENALDLRQLHITCPQDRGVFAGEVAAQQIVSVALLGGFELCLVGVKREGRARDFLVFLRKLNLHEPEGSSCIFSRSANTHQQLIALRQTLPHRAMFTQQMSE